MMTGGLRWTEELEVSPGSSPMRESEVEGILLVHLRLRRQGHLRPLQAMIRGFLSVPDW
jgi:hypothetical protein